MARSRRKKRRRPPAIKLKPAERGRLVQILRCAADLMIRDDELRQEFSFAPIQALMGLGFDVNNPVYSLAWGARDAVDGDRDEWKLLEAAARIEEESWP